MPPPELPTSTVAPDTVDPTAALVVILSVALVDFEDRKPEWTVNVPVSLVWSSLAAPISTPPVPENVTGPLVDAIVPPFSASLPAGSRSPAATLTPFAPVTLVPRAVSSTVAVEVPPCLIWLKVRLDVLSLTAPRFALPPTSTRAVSPAASCAPRLVRSLRAITVRLPLALTVVSVWTVASVSTPPPA